jgi:hypothetical protein
MTKIEKLMSLTRDNIMYVYSGKAYACCCGCSGTYRYNSNHIREGSKDRGYAVAPNEVNNRQVMKVLNIIKKNSHLLEEDLDDSSFSVTVDKRLYMIKTIYINI